MVIKKVRKINRKGFTLVELLVVIVIIGIITVLALPGVQQLQARNRNKKYETYSDTLESAGKLYTDSYANDMFGMTGNGCFDIPYAELKGKSLIKDYEVDGISCDDANTFVQVKREGNRYTYNVSMKCTKGTEVVYENVLSTCNAQSLVTSDIPVILVDIENQGGYDDWSTSKKIKIKVVSKDGLKDNASISYGWTTDPNVLPTDMKHYNFKNDTNDYEVTMDLTETGKNGIWYLVIDGDDLIDVGGRYAADKIVESIKFDNTKPTTPVLNNPYDGVWVGDAFAASGQYTIGVTSSDNPSGIREYQYRYPNSTNEWTSYANSNTDNFTTTAFTEARDEIVEIRACDYAGLCSDPATSTIKIDRSVPSCTVNLSGTTGENGWYKSNNVTVTLSTSDSGGSAVTAYGLTTSTSATYNSTTSGTQGNTTGVTWYGYVKDTAGNTATCNSGNFKVDTTAPSCSLNVAASGITFASATDTGGSALAKQGINKSTTAAYGTNSMSIATGTFYGHVKDTAGNTARCSRTVTGTTAYDYVCGSYACGSYACGSYVCGSYACGTYRYACGSYQCGAYCTVYADANCYACGLGSRCCGCSYNYCTSYCTGTSYCDSYCTSYCTSYCDSYCTGYSCSSGYTKLNDSYCYK